MPIKVAITTAICAVLVAVGYVQLQLNRKVVGSDLFPLMSSQSTVPESAVQSATTTTSTSLSIPKLGLNMLVVPVGIDKDGAMAVPKKSDQAGWFKHGPQPGQVGSAVIDGHYRLINNVDGVFRNIDKLQAGDDLYYQDSARVRHHFIVKSNETYKINEAPKSRIFEAKDAARLNLITCAGKFDKATNTYTQRRVVYAVLAE